MKSCTSSFRALIFASNSALLGPGDVQITNLVSLETSTPGVRIIGFAVSLLASALASPTGLASCIGDSDASALAYCGVHATTSNADATARPTGRPQVLDSDTVTSTTYRTCLLVRELQVELENAE